MYVDVEAIIIFYSVVEVSKSTYVDEFSYF